jgi:hypothetical protein
MKMRIIKRYTDNLEEIMNPSYTTDSYTPNMGDFSLDINTFLDAKLDMILIKSQRTLKTYLPSEKSVHPTTPTRELSHDYWNNSNN